MCYVYLENDTEYFACNLMKQKKDSAIKLSIFECYSLDTAIMIDNDNDMILTCTQKLTSSQLSPHVARNEK